MSSVPESFRLEAAREVQRRLAQRVVEKPLGEVDVIAAVDVAYEGDLAYSAAVAYSMRESRVLATAHSINKVLFPYVPTLLSFRELMPMVRALLKLPVKYDVVMVDGQGRAHPYRLGIASHLGVVLDVASIGVAKSKLYGDVVGDKLVDPISGEVIGAIVRCRKPLYVSVGHKATLEDAQSLVKSLCTNSVMPLPILLAHNEANRAKRIKPKSFDKWGEAV